MSGKAVQDFKEVMLQKKKEQGVTEQWVVELPVLPKTVTNPKIRRALHPMTAQRSCIYCQKNISICDLYFFINSDRYVVHGDCLPSIMFYNGFNANGNVNIRESCKVSADVQLQVSEYCNFYSFDPCTRCWNHLRDTPSFFRLNPCNHILCVLCLPKAVMNDGYDLQGFLQCWFCSKMSFPDE